MPHALTIRSEVKGGRLSQRARRQIVGTLALYEGRDVEILIRTPKRSTQANAYLWAAVYPPIQAALAELGKALPCEALHEYFCRKYLPPAFRTLLNGEELVVRGKSSELGSTEFFDFVEAVRTDEMVLALGVVVDDPAPSYRSYRIQHVPA